jgi:hypothetical protein
MESPASTREYRTLPALVVPKAMDDSFGHKQDRLEWFTAVCQNTVIPSIRNGKNSAS